MQSAISICNRQSAICLSERDAEVDLGNVEPGAFGGDPEVARDRQRDAAADRIAVQARDRRHLGLLDRANGAPAELRGVAPLAFGRAGVRRHSRRRRRALAVGAGAERGAAAAENDGARLEVRSQTLEDLGDRLERRRVERVSPLPKARAKLKSYSKKPVSATGIITPPPFACLRKAKRWSWTSTNSNAPMERVD